MRIVNNHLNELTMIGTYANNSGPGVIKHFLYSTKLSTKFILVINVKMPTIVDNCWHFNIY